MNRIAKIMLSAIVPLAAMTAVGTHASSAEAQVVVYPSDAYVASYRPVYYNGYAHYYYGGRWSYYRPGYGWYGYDHAPAEICHYQYDYYGDRSVACN